MTGINRKSEIYEKVKTKSLCILICSLHLIKSEHIQCECDPHIHCGVVQICLLGFVKMSQPMGRRDAFSRGQSYR